MELMDLQPAQSTEHGMVLHDCDTEASGQSSPPLSVIVVMANVLVWMPPPQLAEQELQPP